MSTHEKRDSYVALEDHKYITGGAMNEPISELSETTMSFTVLSPERIEIMMRDGIQKSRRHTMKNYCGEEIEMSLEFSLKRDGLSSTDDEESEEEEETHVTMTKKVSLGTRFSQIMGSNFLSKGVSGSEKGEVSLEAIRIQINEAVAHKKSRSRRRKRGVGKSRGNKFSLSSQLD
ncbi:hypothetical protein DID88_002727 [Monilinia fructigena]|uniref:Uncharacterized protein n=1 Tax=Monilinia fructigena TaxID=38457 RepID=A0A395IPZ5_9HELO|nr:hypothetical protein DID88_002727 [Monilinia fructigena]